MADHRSPVRSGSPGRGGHSPRGSFRSRSRSRGSPTGSGSPGRGSFASGHFQMPMPASESYQPVVRVENFAPGKVGARINLIANFFKLHLIDVTVLHYDVAIVKERSVSAAGNRPGNLPTEGRTPTPTEAESIANNLERFIKKFALNILERFLTSNPTVFDGIQYVYDGYKSVYAVKPLEFAIRSNEFSSRVSVDIDGRMTDFSVTLKLVGKVDLSEVQKYYRGKQKTVLSDRVVSIYEQVIHFIMAKQYSVFQRKFFDMSTAASSSKVSLCDFVSGFTSAVRMTEFGLALNLHLKTSCLVAQNFTRVLDLVKALLPLVSGARPTRAQLAKASRFLRHLKVCTTHSGRTITYTIDSLVDKTPYELKFKKDGEEVTIADYFHQQHGIELQVLPLIKTTGQMARFMPLELCFLLPSQFVASNKLNTGIQRELLLKSTHTPNAYFKRLTTVAEKVSTLYPEIQQEYGIEIYAKPTSLQGRVLPSPEQLNADKRSIFYKVKSPLVKWSVFCFETAVNNEDLVNFVRHMMERSSQLGLELGTPSPVTKVEVKDHNTINVFYNLSKKAKPEIVFVGLPNHHSQIHSSLMYSMVKHFCDQKYGIISQCFKAEYITKIPVGYFDNFLLKVNGKLGGLNAILAPSNFAALPFSSARTMIVGIDVSHPGETERVSSSIAAAVGTLDPMFNTYTASIRVQKKEREEVITNLDVMIAELLNEYLKANRYLPDNLIFFRDGVSDGEFDVVRQTEILKLQQSIINKAGKPMKITFIVTQKNHNARFARAELSTSARKPTWNVPSGTVVDTTIVNPAYKMFYLNSHFSPLGTSHPTKYVILRDDLNMDADTVQRLCFLVCFNNVRTRTVISLPTPVRYANLCAYRAKNHLEAQRALGELSGTGREEVDMAIIDRLNEMVKVNDDMKQVLYYA